MGARIIIEETVRARLEGVPGRTGRRVKRDLATASDGIVTPQPVLKSVILSEFGVTESEKTPCREMQFAVIQSKFGIAASVRFAMIAMCDAGLIGQMVVREAEISGFQAEAGCSILPGALAEHPLVQFRDFYTLPRELLEQVVEDLGEDRFDKDVLHLDRQLSAFNGDHSTRIGFRNGVPIRYDLLGDPRSLIVDLAEVTDEMRKQLRWTPEWGRNPMTLRQADERIAWIRNNCRGYAGWLALNSEFAREQQDFFIRWQNEIAAFGLVRQFGQQFPPMSLAPITATPQSFRAYIAARDGLLRRWQLVNLAGPLLPDPIRTMMPLLDSADKPQAWALGTSLYLAAIFPLPDRKLLREMVEDSLNRNDSPSHLRDWLELVRGENPAKKRIARYARIFLLQHFWRVLHFRHTTALKRQQSKLRRAFAAHFFPKTAATSLDAKSETIRKDLDLISTARGGPGWQYPSSRPRRNRRA